MFSLNKSLAQLKSAVEGANLAKKEAAANGEEATAQPDKQKKKIAPKRKRGVQKKNASNGSNLPSRKGVVMIKNFPHGFYEKQMFDYFSQFGEVTRLKIARSRKTGNPKSYGFIEFQFEDVAKIAADTMNNYLMFDHIVKCILLPEEKVPKNLFQNWNRPYVSTVKSHKAIHNREKNDVKEYKLLVSRLKRVHTMEKKLADKGITFKCVIANRPTGLSKPSKNDPKASKAVSKVSKASKPMKEVILKSTPTTRRPALRRNVTSSFKVEPL